MPPYKTPSAESCLRNCGMSERGKCFQHFKTASLRPSMHTNGIESLSIEWYWRSWRLQLKSMSLHTRNPTTVATVAATKISSRLVKATRTTAMNNTPKAQCKFCFGPQEIYNICKLLKEHANNLDHVNQMRTVKSTAKFIKNCSGNSCG